MCVWVCVGVCRVVSCRVVSSVCVCVCACVCVCVCVSVYARIVALFFISRAMVSSCGRAVTGGVSRMVVV